MFDKLKENIKRSKKIIFEMSSMQIAMEAGPLDEMLYNESMDAYEKQLVVLNDTVPELLKEVMPDNEDKKVKKEEKKRASKSKDKTESKLKSDSSSVSVKMPGGGGYVTINKKDKKEFMNKLMLTEGALSKITKAKEVESGNVLSKPSFYVKFSNKIFRGFSDSMNENFASLGKNLKKSNNRYMLSSYLSMMFMSTLLAFVGGIIIAAAVMLLGFGGITYLLVPIILPLVVFLLFFIEPSSDAKSSQKKVSQELPFVTIYMSAIAGSNIEPVKLFKIIAASPDYPNVGAELRKVIAQIEIYGYDLVMALKNVVERTSNKDLAELFSGIATNISTGGALENYLEKKADNFLNDYKLERQKYSELAGTFMDVYISILIAAPLILMMMFIIMNVAGLGIGGMSISTLLFLGVIGISVANVIFLVVLNAKQPSV